jgi:hypothetical protein
MPPKLFFQAENLKLDLMNSLFPVRNQKLPRTCGLKFMLYLCEMLPNHASVPVNLLPHIFVPAHQPDIIHQTTVPEPRMGASRASADPFGGQARFHSQWGA